MEKQPRNSLSSSLVISAFYAPMTMRLRSTDQSGTAIYVVCVIIGNETHSSFILDGEKLPNTFDLEEDSADFIRFNTTVYSNSSINPTGAGPDGIHNLTMITLFDVAFDFAIYTYVALSNTTKTT